MLTYKLITQDEYDNFLQLLLNEAADYLSHTLELMQMSLEEAQALFRATGQVFAIYQDAALAGYYWIEERGDILHLHGLVLRQECQGQGIGSQVLAMLAEQYAQKMTAIELGVHQSNVKARQLYERVGYQVVKYLDDLGYFVLQRPLTKSL
jgi:ribosomal protein S18 acetylase RimI-like enzyme